MTTTTLPTTLPAWDNTRRYPCADCGGTESVAIRSDGLRKCHRCDLVTPPSTNIDYRQIQVSPRPTPQPQRKIAHLNQRETDRFEFHGEGGQLVATKIRYDYDNEDGTPGKTFRLDPKGAQLPLYRLPCVLSAARQGWQVFLCEGERKSDLIELYIRNEWGLDAAATSFAHWKPDFAQHFRGAAIAIILPDRDEPGQRKARAVAADLQGIIPVVVRSWEEPV